MADTARARRLAKRIVAIVATELEHQVKDPRLAMTTITAATVTPDLHDATVFYTVYGDDGERAGDGSSPGQRHRRAADRGRAGDRRPVHPHPDVQAGPGSGDLQADGRTDRRGQGLGRVGGRAGGRRLVRRGGRPVPRTAGTRRPRRGTGRRPFRSRRVGPVDRGRGSPAPGECYRADTDGDSRRRVRRSRPADGGPTARRGRLGDAARSRQSRRRCAGQRAGPRSRPGTPWDQGAGVLRQSGHGAGVAASPPRSAPDPSGRPGPC